MFGSGGGAGRRRRRCRRALGAQVPLLGQVPIDVRLREGGDNGQPLVLSDPDAPRRRKELLTGRRRAAGKPRGLAGMSLGLSPRAASRTGPAQVVSGSQGAGSLGGQRARRRGERRAGRTGSSLVVVARAGASATNVRGCSDARSRSPSSGPSSVLRSSVIPLT